MQMADAEVSAVVAIAGEVHILLPERPEVFAEKRRVFPRGAFSLLAGGEVVGYALAHPWQLDEVPALDAFLGATLDSADCLFLHDVAILPWARGSGAASRLIELLADVALSSGLRRLALVSVYRTRRLWGRLGFQERELGRARAKLASYGEGACYMIRGAGG